jgi:cytochrome c5
MLKPFMFFSAVVLLGFASASAPARSPQEATPAPAPAAPAVKNPVRPTAESQNKAKKLYQMDCALCHGDNGDGKTDVAKSMELTLTDWTDPKSLTSKSDQDLFNVIRNGKDKMPAEGDGRAPNDVVWNLVIYIRNMSKGHPAATPAATPSATAPAPGN